MSFDYRKLRGKIREIYGTQEEFAKAMGMSYTSLSARLNNKIQWGQLEMDRALKILGLNDSDMTVYFFTPKV